MTRYAGRGGGDGLAGEGSVVSGSEAEERGEGREGGM